MRALLAIAMGLSAAVLAFGELYVVGWVLLHLLDASQNNGWDDRMLAGLMAQAVLAICCGFFYLLGLGLLHWMHL